MTFSKDDIVLKKFILDIEEENGLYKIEEGVSQKDCYLKEWKNLIIRNAEKVPLSIIFLNKSIIKQNRYNIFCDTRKR